MSGRQDRIFLVRRTRFSLSVLVLSCSLAGGVLAADAESPVVLPFDTPTMVDGVEAVCTGIGQDSRADPRWNAYPLKVVLAGEGGQFLGAADVNVAAQGETRMDVRCGGPWVLFKLEPGRYAITAKINGNTAKSIANVSSAGQGRIILRFPAVGGAISPEHEPAIK
jgi:hypothetical protein